MEHVSDRTQDLGPVLGISSARSHKRDKDLGHRGQGKASQKYPRAGGKERIKFPRLHPHKGVHDKETAPLTPGQGASARFRFRDAVVV